MSLSKLITISLTLLTPLIFWTLTPNFISTPKEALLIIATAALIIHSAVTSLTKRHLSLPPLTAAVPLGLFLLSIVGSLLFNPEGRPEALSGKGLMLIALPTLSFLLLSTNQSKLRNTLKNTLIIVGSLLSLHSLLSLTFLSKMPFMPSFMQSISFTPTGSYLSTLVFILNSAALSIASLKTESRPKYLYYASLIINTIATVAIVSLMFPGGSLRPVILSLGASWSIALDALKSLRSLFFGIGISNYSLLYTTVKPISVLSTPLWNTTPVSAGSEILTILPTAGVLATASLLYLMLKTLLNSLQTELAGATIITVIALLVMPIGLPLYLLFFILYSLSLDSSPRQIKLTPPSHLIVFGFQLVAALLLIFPAGRSYISEYLVKQAQNALASNDSQKVYDLQVKALQISPNITNYQLSFADINFRLASALSQKQDLTDADRDTIAKLVQQSISAGKNAISLRPNDSRTWLTIATIYQNLINVASGADSFAVQAFSRALTLDRANPTLHLQYANLLSQLAQTQKEATVSSALRSQAVSEMQTAIQLKNDYANAYYNLAKIYETAKDYPSAIIAMENAVKYLDPNSSDYGLATSELETLKNKQSPTTPTPSGSPQPSPKSSTLTEPSPLPSPIDGGPVEIAPTPTPNP